MQFKRSAYALRTPYGLLSISCRIKCCFDFLSSRKIREISKIFWKLIRERKYYESRRINDKNLQKVFEFDAKRILFLIISFRRLNVWRPSVLFNILTDQWPKSVMEKLSSKYLFIVYKDFVKWLDSVSQLLLLFSYWPFWKSVQNLPLQFDEKTIRLLR